jgi:hemolysin III
VTTIANEPERAPDVPAKIAAVLEQRPLLRGTLHLAMAIAAPFLLVLLMLIADSPREYVAGSIYSSTLIALYVTSASYHMAPWPTPWRGIMKRLDHSMIFALIAGTYTPFCLLVVGDAWGISLLSVVWTLAGFGMLLKIAWPNAPRWLSVGLYLALGWVGIVAAVPLVSNLGAWGSLTVLLGGLMYTVGSLAYAFKRPNPYPAVFGYHEVFHAFVIAGSITHFALISAYVFDL